MCGGAWRAGGGGEVTNSQSPSPHYIPVYCPPLCQNRQNSRRIRLRYIFIAKHHYSNNWQKSYLKVKIVKTVAIRPRINSFGVFLISIVIWLGRFGGAYWRRDYSRVVPFIFDGSIRTAHLLQIQFSARLVAAVNEPSQRLSPPCPCRAPRPPVRVGSTNTRYVPIM